MGTYAQSEYNGWEGDSYHGQYEWSDMRFHYAPQNILPGMDGEGQ